MTTFGWRHHTSNNKRTPFLISIAGAGLALIILFLVNFSYIYGAVFKSGSRVHNFNILAVDLDSSFVGESLPLAYQQLQGDGFPSLQFQSPLKFPSAASIRDAVCRGDYWAAVYAQPGASSRLEDAFRGGAAASNYTAANAFGLVVNTARYPAVQLGDISGNLQALIGATRCVYLGVNGQQALTSVNNTDRNALLALFNPIQSTTIDIRPTNQGSRVLYNTVGIVFPLLQQFFFHMAMNNFYVQFSMHGRLHQTRIISIRLIIGVVYTFFPALMVTGVLWAFSEGWGLNGTQFVLTWMAYWLLMHVGFLVMDTAVAFIPPAFLSFFVLTWIITNISSIVFPFELSAGFYHWAYALPGHEIYQILVQIWSGGCNNQLHHALPVMFTWEVIGTCTTILGARHKGRTAIVEVEDKTSTGNASLVSRDLNEEKKKDSPERDGRN